MNPFGYLLDGQEPHSGSVRSRTSSVASRPNSVYSTSSRSSRSSRSNPRVRVFVVLPNGTKIAIPIAVTSTVADLQAEALRRIQVLHLSYDGDSPVLRLGTKYGAIAFEEDLVEDVLDLADDSTFWLGPLDQDPETDLGPAQPTGRDYQVYVRWVTVSRAITYSRLGEIAADTDSFPSTTTVSQLKVAALDRLYRGRFVGEEKPPPNARTELFLTTCHLSTTNADSMTLAELQLEGTPVNPLELFIVLQKPDIANSAKPYSTWPFTHTERGSATFFTSLKVLMREVKSKGGLQEILKVLWEITHFPPALLSFQQLHDEQKLLQLPSTILATCFREIALEMIPPWIADNRDEVLESSRQIFSWVYSLYSEASKKPAGTDFALVHSVSLTEISGTVPTPDTDSGTNTSIVAFLASNDVEGQPSSSSPRALRRVSVCRERKDTVSAQRLAMAQWGSYDAIQNYYVDWPAGSENYTQSLRHPLLEPADFNNLLISTNQSDAFKLIGPHGLGKAIPPVISLDKDGYVSIYDLRSEECGEYYPTTWNIISELESLSSTDPGQFLAQKLQTIIAHRKKKHCWEVDAWSEESGKIGEIGSPEEAVIICVDRSGSMNSPMGTGWMPTSSFSTTNENLSRLSEVQEVFQNFVARTAAYKLPIQLGLVVFPGCADVETNQELTPVLYDFKDRIKDITPRGMTAIWDSLVRAQEMLVKFGAANPTTKLRIIVLTDGEDNNSQASIDKAALDLYHANIVVDSIVIGTKSTDDLFKISKHTGGYAFCPKTRSELFQVFLLETFVDIKMRPDIVRIPIYSSITNSTPKDPDMGKDSFDFPKCRQHPNENDSFIDLRQSSKFFLPSSRGSVSGRSTYSQSSASTITARTPSSNWDTMTLNSQANSIATGASGAHRIILREVRLMAANHHPYMDVYISESNMGFWKVVMQGPPASPYSIGTFVLYIEMGDRFPRQAPSARFITPILHPNITKHGRICHAIFDRDWHPEMHIYEVLQSVYGILMTLEVRDAVDPMATLKFWTDPKRSEKEVTQYIRHFATNTRAWHKQKILESS